MDKVYVVTAVHNRYKITERFVNNLLKQTYKNWTFVLVDDGSTDNTALMVKKKINEVEVLQGDGNLWWGGALQKAFEWICSNVEDQEDIIFLANDDIIIDDIEFIERALKTLKKNKKSLLTSTGYDNETKVISDGPINLNYITYKEQILKSYSKANCASTRALFLRVGDFLNIGGFKPKLLPHY